MISTALLACLGFFHFSMPVKLSLEQCPRVFLLWSSLSCHAGEERGRE